MNRGSGSFHGSCLQLSILPSFAGFSKLSRHLYLAARGRIVHTLTRSDGNGDYLFATRPGDFGLPVRLPARLLVLRGQWITYFLRRWACHSAAVISHISDRRRPET
jgi:hypothetical protein